MADGHAAEEIRGTFGYDHYVYEVLPGFVDLLLRGLAKFHHGELRVKAPGSAHDNKKLADLAEYMVATDLGAAFRSGGGS